MHWQIQKQTYPTASAYICFIFHELKFACNICTCIAHGNTRKPIVAERLHENRQQSDFTVLTVLMLVRIFAVLFKVLPGH